MSIQKRSILFVVPWGMEVPGGVNQVVVNLMRQFRNHDDFQPLLLINSWHDRDIDERAFQGYRCFYFHLRSPFDRHSPLKNFVSFLLEFPGNVSKLHRFISRENICAINAHFPVLFFSQFLLMKALGGFRGAAILSYHGSDIRGAKLCTGMRRWLHRQFIKMADGIVTCSESLKMEITDFVPAAASKTQVVHNGIDPERILAEKTRPVGMEALGTPSFLLSLATYDGKKGLDVLIRAFGEIAPERPDLSLVILGRSTQYRAVLDGLVRELKLEGRVHMPGALPHHEATAWLERAELFVLPSRYEAFGIAILEAGLFRKPVVATRVGGISEIITHREHGVLVEPDDPAQLRNAINELLDCRESAQRYAENLYKHVIADFTWEKAYERYRELLSSKG